MDSRIREDIVDRGIAKGEWEMRNLSRQLGYESSGQISADAADQTRATPVSKDEGSTRRDISKDDIRNHKVDPEAVRESFKEAELDPIAENEPEEGESAA